MKIMDERQIKHQSIDKKKLIEEYKKEISRQKSMRVSNVWDTTYIKNLEEIGLLYLIESLPDKKYKIFYDSVLKESAYVIWSKETKTGVLVAERKVKPASVREALRNIEENKK